MKLRIITDQEYVTVPIQELHLIQKTLDATSLLILAHSTSDPEIINNNLRYTIECFSILNKYIDNGRKPSHNIKNEDVEQIVIEDDGKNPTSNVVQIFPKK